MRNQEFSKEHVFHRNNEQFFEKRTSKKGLRKEGLNIVQKAEHHIEHML